MSDNINAENLEASRDQLPLKECLILSVILFSVIKIITYISWYLFE